MAFKLFNAPQSTCSQRVRFKPTFYPGSLLSEQFPHLSKKAGSAA